MKLERKWTFYLEAKTADQWAYYHVPPLVIWATQEIQYIKEKRFITCSSFPKASELYLVWVCWRKNFKICSPHLIFVALLWNVCEGFLILKFSFFFFLNPCSVYKHSVFNMCPLAQYNAAIREVDEEAATYRLKIAHQTESINTEIV